MPVQSEAQEYISSCDCPTYLVHAEKRLGEEAERVQTYLDPASEPRVVKVRFCLRLFQFL